MQEITVKTFSALLVKDNIVNIKKFIWRIVHNTLSNCYSNIAKSMINVSVDEVEEMVAYLYSKIWIDNNAEIIRRLQTEIAYLSKLQRRIIIEYYFENRKQTDIEIELGIPLGNIKWHLFESKKN